MGWVLWRSKEFLPESMVFHTNVRPPPTAAGCSSLCDGLRLAEHAEAVLCTLCMVRAQDTAAWVAVMPRSEAGAGMTAIQAAGWRLLKISMQGSTRERGTLWRSRCT